MKPKNQRKLGLALIIGLLSLSLGLVLYALSEKVTFFYTPSDIANGKATVGKTIRVGGMVKQGSITYSNDHIVQFTLADFNHTLKVSYKGIPPNLFKEGQGAVCIGILLEDQTFKATTIMAKHDETYRPPEMEHKGDGVKS